MILKYIWVSLMFLGVAAIVFIASFGIDIQIAYYDRVDTVVCLPPSSSVLN